MIQPVDLAITDKRACMIGPAWFHDTRFIPRISDLEIGELFEALSCNQVDDSNYLDGGYDDGLTIVDSSWFFELEN